MTMKAVTLASYPEGLPTLENFAITFIEKPVINQENSFIAKVLYVSVDPYMRGRMRPSRDSYAPPFQLGQPIAGFLVAEVVETNSTNYPVETLVTTIGPFTEYIILNEKAPLLSKLQLEKSLASQALGVLGMPGMTAYFGFHDICQPKAGETLVVSGAAGAVGGYVAQLGKIAGCKVIGIAGTDEKNEVLKNEFGVDATINYKTENVLQKLKEYAPSGVDMYFDNVGGEITDAVFEVLNLRARVSSCGSISAYNKTEADLGPRHWGSIISKGIKVEGFIVTRDYGSRWGEGVAAMTKLFRENKIKGKETVTFGIDNVPAAFIQLMTGGNIGKQIVQF